MKHEPGTVVTRFPPSPTGKLQIGNIRTALFNYLYARKHGGRFVLRIEDTDKERSKKEYEEAIIQDLEWLQFEYDDFARQSDRAGVHKKYLETLVAKGKAYVSKEGAAEGKRDSVIRFKNPNRVVTFHDEVRGEISMDTTDLGDFVIAKDFNEPLYHLGVVIDDYEMGVTHVIRGEDHISNTPRQILLLEAIGAPIPIYGHLPLVLAPDKSKLSKRNGSVSLEHLREAGYLREAVINFMALLGWNPGTEQEIFSLEELIDAFDLSKIQKSGGVFNIERLNWFNREYLKRMPEEEFATAIAERLAGTPGLIDVIKRSPAARNDLQERITTLSDVEKMAALGDFQFYLERPTLEPSKIAWKNSEPTITAERLEKVVEILEKIPEGEFYAEILKAAVFPYAEKEGKGEVLWPIRYGLSGRDRSPDPFTLGEALGRNETLIRLKDTIAILRNL